MTDTSRRLFLGQSLLAAAMATAGPLTPALSRVLDGPKAGPNHILRVGVVGVRGRGRAHIGGFKKSPDSEVVAICDCDEGVIGPAQKSVPEAKFYRDMREMFADESIDAVTIATPNHWHSLAAIWALQAGKHVYVEKPVSHNVHEGRKLVEAAAKSGKIVQVGTQSRSQPATMEAMEWLRAGGIGRVDLAYGLCYKRRKTIGKVDGPQQPPETLDYDMWTGPAAMEPLMRANLHYDWHWVFNTGNGDIGNQGVHQMDIARWGMALDRHPARIDSLGGRLGYDDDGDTPNTQLTMLDYGDKQVVFEVRGLETPSYRGASIGVVFIGEEGYLVSASYEKLQAFDKDGKLIKEFKGRDNHYQNFLDAVKAGDKAGLNAPIEEGHLSAAMGHLGNISYQLGTEQPLLASEAPFRGSEAANGSFTGMVEHLKANGVDPASCAINRGVELRFNNNTERFFGDNAAADALLTRPARAGYAVPDQV